MEEELFLEKIPLKSIEKAAYAVRWVAKSLVASSLCKRVLVQISNSISIADPLSIHINTYETVVNGKTNIYLFDTVVNNFN